MAELKKRFPADMAYNLSRHDAPRHCGRPRTLITLLEAFVLVVLIVYLFLQTWRATLIPILTVPVSLIGVFALFPLLGFSINTLSLFGLVLAVGFVVDDAIVVVEAVERHIEEGMTAKEATQKAMGEVSGPGHCDRPEHVRRVQYLWRSFLGLAASINSSRSRSPDRSSSPHSWRSP